MFKKSIIDWGFKKLLSQESKDKAEKSIIWIAIVSFIIHLGLIAMTRFGILSFSSDSDLFRDPISAIYTPFSFYLLFEVYLLVYHIPQSTTTYVAKQYEIITLIVVRRLFKDIANLELSSDWFGNANDLQFTFDVITTLILFLLIAFFHALIQKNKKQMLSFEKLDPKIRIFVKRKRLLALLLVPIIIILAAYSLGDWMISSFNAYKGSEYSDFQDINKIFFDEFFMLLILTDVLLLLFSFFHTTKFNLVIRNTGFILSTILLRLSFHVEGFMNNALIIVAVLFGLAILAVNQKFAKHILNE